MAWRIPTSISVSGVAIDLGTSDSLFVSAQTVVASTEAQAVKFQNAPAPKIVVHGTVVATQAAILGDNFYGADILVGETGRVQSFHSNAMALSGIETLIRNAGVIETLDVNFAAVSLDAMEKTPGTVNIENTGTIRGPGYAIFASDTVASSKVINEGLLDSDLYSFMAVGESVDTLINTGTIRGNIVLGGGDDLLDSRNGSVLDEVFGGAGNDRLYTGAGSQQLYGEAGSNILMGGAGADTLYGGAETDTASYASATSGLTVNLANAAANSGDAKGDVFLSIERLIGSKFADTLVGNATGNQLTGGGGADTLTGGAGADRFVFNVKPAGTASADRITDFVTDTDELRLDDAVFSGLAKGDLAGAAFWASDAGTAHDGTDRVIYEKDTGWIRFDADGNGAGASVAFAKLAAGLNLGADDFVVF